MQKTDARRLNRQVQKYKNQQSDNEKNRQFQTILEILTNHIRAISMYLLGYVDRKVSKKVQKYMLSNMKATSSIKDTQQFLSTLQQNVQLAGYDEDDVRQIIYQEIVKLIGSYKYEKVSFLQYVTYLLPRRIQDIFWKHSKDQMNQMNVIKDITEIQDFDEYLYNNLESEEKEKLSPKYLEEIATDYEKQQKLHEEQLMHQLLKYKKRKISSAHQEDETD